jgi:ATP-dependent Clp protease protease subunit
MENQSSGATLDALSLQSMGAYMLFEEVNNVSALKVCDFIIRANMLIKNPETTLTLFVNTPGGSVFDGWSIVDVMGTSRLGIQTVGMGKIISMGVPIFVAGTKGKRILTPNSTIMAHTFSAGLYGKSHELIAARKVHDRIDQQFVQHFVRNTKMTEKQVRDILIGTTDTWLEPKECLKYGICDEIHSPWDLEEDAEKEAKKPQSRTKKAAASSKVNK